MSREQVTPVEELMSKDVIAVRPNTPLDEALSLMLNNHVRRLPVVDQSGRLVGILSDRDLRLAADSPFLQETPEEVLEHLAQHTVGEIMHTAIHTIEASAPVVEAAKLMRVARVGGLPVVNQAGDLVGIITRSDLIDHLIRLLEPVETTGERPP
ncbi:MAG: CBS domain-containing protein [Ardenticatenia bacterium]|nr:CBS domain-containing protein [Ardenticatenia bacterium]